MLHGADIIQDLEIDRSFYRAHIEYELRAKHIRLRQKASDLLATPEKLLRLMADSLSTFCVLGRHALVLSGQEACFQKVEILTGLERLMDRRLDASREVLALRSTPKQYSSEHVRTLLERYLEEMGSLVRFVDALDR